ncbi:GNAT family N-acetyltransferase [bacterium]|nr:MAG: GNAT family N-acetyltransferase [bacterium]
MPGNTVKLLDHRESERSIELMDLVFNEQGMEKLNVLSRDYWEWQNCRHPGGCSKIWTVEDEKKKIIAQYVNIPARLSVNGRRADGGITIDLLVDPNHRRQGLFKILGKSAIDDLEKAGMDFQLAFPRREKVHNGFINRLNWEKIGDLSLLVKPMDLMAALEKKISNGRVVKIIKLAAGPLKALSNKISRGRKKNKFVFRLMDNLPEKVNDLSRIFISEFPISIIRDKAYLEWRYIQKPEGNYKILGIFNGDDLLGIIVLKIKRVFSLDVGFIVDILSVLDNEVIDSLIKEALRLFSKERAGFCASVMTKNNIYYRSLRKNGFFRVPRKINPMRYILDAHAGSKKIDKKFFYEIDNWFITIGDWDIL